MYGEGPTAAAQYNQRLYNGAKTLLSLLHNARAYVVSDDDRDLTYDAFLERFLVSAVADEDAMDVDDERGSLSPVNLSTFVHVLSQFPAYNDLNVHVRAIAGRIGCNAETRKKVDNWVRRASSAGGVTRLIVFVVPTFADYLAYVIQKRSRPRIRTSIDPPRVDKRIRAYLRGILQRSGIAIELLHLTDVEHMHRMRRLYASMPWRNGVVQSPCMAEKLALLTETPYADQAALDDPDDLLGALEYEEKRMRTTDVKNRFLLSGRSTGSLPLVAVGDWVPRIFGARLGDVIRYKGPSESAGDRSVWRRVM